MTKREVVIWDITSKCNLKCSHCYNAEKYDETTYNLTFEQALNTVDQITEEGFEQIQFVGGEPLMFEKFVKLAEYILSKGVRVSLTTNGWFLDQYGTDLVDLGVSSIFVSLDGTTEEVNDAVRGKGVFERVTRNAQQLAQYIKESEKDTVLGISYTVTRMNFDDLPHVIEFAAGLGAGGLFISFLSHEGRARDSWSEVSAPVDETLNMLESLMKTYQEFPPMRILIESRPLLVEYFKKKFGMPVETSVPYLRCTGGSRNICILADGTVLPCGVCGSRLGHSQDHMFERENLNVLTHSLNNILNSRFFTTFRQFVEDPAVYNITECKTCPNQPVCAPCPLVFYKEGKEGSIEECRWVKTQMKNLYEDVLPRVPVKVEGLRTDAEGDTVTVESGGKKVVLEGTAGLIWNHIDNSKTTEQIIKTLLQQVTAADAHIVYEDVITFMLELKNANVITMNSEKRLSLKSRFILRKERFGGILYDKAENQVIFTDQSTCDILTLCDGTRTAAAIAEKVYCDAKVPVEKCSQYLQSYIDMNYVEEM